MTTEQQALKRVLEQIENGNQINEKEINLLATSARQGDITIATGERAVAIGGNVDNTVIITGDRNLVVPDSSAETLRALLGKRPQHEKSLLKAVKNEVDARLRQSLHNSILIEVSMEEQPSQIKSLWETDIKIGQKPSEPIPQDWSILRVFEEMQGRFLILGNPGVGKTTKMLELARELCDRAQEEGYFPIPILLNISTWKNNKQSIEGWLKDELNLKYGVQRKTAQKLIKSSSILPMLDGLDELENLRQPLCVENINNYLKSDIRPQYLVIASREEEYSNYSQKLSLNGAISLKKLNEEKIKDYLRTLKQENVWTQIQENLQILELSKTPFFLNIIILLRKEIPEIFSDQNIEKKEQVKKLLDAYIKKMMQREIKGLSKINKNLSSTKFYSYLAWLSSQLEKKASTEFLIEKIDFSFLDKKRRRTAKIFFWVSLYSFIIFSAGFFWTSTELLIPVLLMVEGRLDGLVSWQSYNPSENYLLNWSSGEGVWYSIIFAIIASRSKKIFLQQESFAWKKERAKIGLFIVLPPILGFALYDNVFTSFSNPLEFIGALAGTGVNLGILSFFSGLKAMEIEEKRHPNQGISETIKKIYTLGLTIGFLILFINLGDAVSFLFDIHIAGTVRFGALSGAAIAIVYFFKAVATCWHHFILRVILHLQGYIPWNYTIFLDACTERMFLQKVGGRYRFIHRFLQEHFSQMQLK